MTDDRKYVVVVGNPTVGKTSLLITYAYNEFPEVYVPVLLDEFKRKVTINDQICKMVVVDTADESDFTDYNPTDKFFGTDCFLICYSIVDRLSFEDCEIEWFPEVRDYCPTAETILVGLKSDLRASDPHPVTPKEASELCKRVKCPKHFECSAKTSTGISELFNAVAVACLSNSNVNRTGVSERVKKTNPLRGPVRAPRRHRRLEMIENEKLKRRRNNCCECILL